MRSYRRRWSSCSSCIGTACGAVGGGVASYATGSDVVDGACGGAIDGLLTSMVPIPIVNDLVGGAAGSLYVDVALDFGIGHDRSKSVNQIAGRAALSSATKLVIGGAFDGAAATLGKQGASLGTQAALNGAGISFGMGSSTVIDAIERVEEIVNTR